MSLSHVSHRSLQKIDNNRSYPSPTDLTTNSTFNTEAEIEYKVHKTGQ